MSRSAALLAGLAACGGGEPAAPAGSILIAERVATGAEVTIVIGDFGPADTIVSSRDDGPCQIEKRLAGLDRSDDAGALTIAKAGDAVAVEAMAGGGYRASLDGWRYAPNDVLAISAAGAVVPAFSTTLAFPAALTMPITLGSVSRSGFSFSWVPLASEVSIALRQAPMNGPMIEVACVYPGADGVATVTSSQLADLSSGASAFVQIGPHTHADVIAGTYAVGVEAWFQTFAASIAIQP